MEASGDNRAGQARTFYQGFWNAKVAAPIVKSSKAQAKEAIRWTPAKALTASFSPMKT